jgi:phosphoribosyl 1,2-cyclic phosphodiesterase
VIIIMQKVRVCTLLSGSSANASYIEINGRGILIDAGAGVKKLGNALESLGSGYDKLEAIFITHEHSDHIGGLSTICKYNKIPVISNKKTLNEIERLCPELDSNLFRIMPTGATAIRGDFEVSSFRSMHDSAECVGYTVKTGNYKIGVVTDLGECTEDMKTQLCGCKIVIIESNHDINMLWNGSYHYLLKKRVAGPLGHLSNAQCGELLPCLIKSGTEKVLLAHLSKENNTPELAMSTVADRLLSENIKINEDVLVAVAPRDVISPVYSV